MTNVATTTSWPALRVEDWTATRDTLHMWTQIVGKIRMAHAPLVNHWWQVTLYVSPRGLTTSAVPYRLGGRSTSSSTSSTIDCGCAAATAEPGRCRCSRCRWPSSTTEPSALAELGSRRRSGGGRTRWTPQSRSPKTTSTPPTTPAPRTCSGANWLAANRVIGEFRSHFVGKVSRCTSSGARWTWPAPASPADPPRRIPAAPRTAGIG